MGCWWSGWRLGCRALTARRSGWGWWALAALTACTSVSAPPGPAGSGRSPMPAPSPHSQPAAQPPRSVGPSTPLPEASSPAATTPIPTSRARAPASPGRPDVRPPAVRFDVDAVLANVAGIVSFGPRDAVSPAFARSTAYVARELTRLGYRVQRQSLQVPAGTSWRIPVRAGTTTNVVADPPGFDPTRPHLLLGAHLDTVPQAPGAEDNASGVAVLLELARMLREQPGRLPVRLVAFGAEEARGRGVGGYAFGSRHYVAQLTPAGRRAVVAMVALDRVGVRAGSVPVCSGGSSRATVADALRRAAGPVPTNACRNRASDHWSFDTAGIPAARVGSVPYPAYHSAADLPAVLDRGQLQRVGVLVWSWLRSPGA